MFFSNYHIPVMTDQIVKYIVRNRNGTYLDCTLGGGGHSEAVLNHLEEDGFVIGVDRDPEAINFASERLKDRKNFKAVNIEFGSLKEITDIIYGQKFDGIIFDLGVSSKQINDPERGFSHSLDGLLDMRMNPENEISARDIVNNYSKKDLQRIFFEFGEENRSAQIAARIVSRRSEREIENTKDLADIVSSVVGSRHRVKSLSRIFQAIRIVVNGELDEIKKALDISVSIMKKGGRAGVISYHSLEDRIVKSFISENSRKCTCPVSFPRCMCETVPEIINVTGKVIRPEDDEIQRNSRSRSAKLRVYEKI